MEARSVRAQRCAALPYLAPLRIGKETIATLLHRKQFDVFNESDAPKAIECIELTIAA